MKKSKRQNRKKTAVWLTVFALCLSLPSAALAEEGPSQAMEEPAPQTPQASQTSQAEPLPSPGPTPAPEELPSEGETLPTENLAAAFAESALLVTGGHAPYMNGAPGGLFLPNKVITRSEAAQMLYNLLAAKPPVSESKFPDVSLSKWYGTAVNALAQAGVFSGYKDGTFGPNDTMTRAQLLTALYMCFDLPEGSCDFADLPKTHWAYKYIATAVAAGWAHGTGQNNFSPDRGVTRAEAVAMMNAALGRTGEGFAADRAIQKFKDVPSSHWAFLHITEAAQPLNASPSPSPEPSEEPSGEFETGQTVRVTVAGLNLRSQANTDAQVVTVLSRGTILTITDASLSPWLAVKTATGQTGYVHSGSAGDPYVEHYTPGTASGASLSNSTLSVHQYQSARLDAFVTAGSVSDMSWASSDPGVATVGYALNIRGTDSKQQCAIVYGKKPGTATLTFSDASGKNKASCRVTVTAAESVRFAYASEHSAVKGESFDLIAVTDPGRSSVTFKIIDGPAPGSFTTNSYSTESRSPSHSGIPTNTVRVFKRSVAFQAAGTYTVRATSGSDTVGQEFTVFVKPGTESVTATSYGERRGSTECMKIIANFEGRVPEIRDDDIAAGNPTVGHGTVVQPGRAFYNNLTETEMYAYLVKTANEGGFTSAVNRFRSNNNLKMSQAQFDALLSLVFNCGPDPLDTKYDLPKVMLNMVAPPAGGISEVKSYPGTTNIGATVMYKSAELSAQTIATIPKNTRITVIGTHTVAAKHQYWYKVRYNSNTGWVPAGYISLDASGLVHDLAYADAASLSHNFLQWHRSDGACIDGLYTRRLAECKIYFFGDYAEAYHSSPKYGVNTYGFNIPSCVAGHE